MARKDKIVTPSVTQKLQDLGYNVADWDDSKTESKLNGDIIEVLNSSSKSQNGKPGTPDRIYCNKNKKLLIIVEEKPTIKEHDIEDIKRGCISGVKWYMSCFLNKIDKFKKWKIIGIAVSGNISKEHQNKLNCFYIEDNLIKEFNNVKNFLTEDQFLSLFNNLNEEKAIEEVSRVSKVINNLLRSIDSQKRPVLLSALMIALYRSPNVKNSFPDVYSEYSGDDILNNLYDTVEKILEAEDIPSNKLKALKGELESIKVDKNLQSSSILKSILNELNKTILPLFETHFSTSSNYDIMGKFYEEFLKYAGVSNVKKGIVLTPRHIASLFTKLVPIKSNDVILDLCCGTGAFLIAGMNCLIQQIQNSSRSDKEEAISKVKRDQLLGFEINPTMYICAISNMLFRGDGKSSIYNLDSINDEKADKILKEKMPTIGFINPPYSGKENKQDPTPKELSFLIKMLDNCSRYGVIIAPISMYFKDKEIRASLLEKHTLKYVINMPKDLFQPNATTHTAIGVFETHKPHDFDKNVIFYDLKDDGFVLSKNKGRSDVYNKWNKIEKDLLESLFNSNKKEDEIILVKTPITPKDEWTLYAHSKTDYSTLSDENFANTVSDYLIFSAKNDMGLLESELSELEMLEMLANYYGDKS